MSEAREYSAFISHSSKDAAVANELVEKLEARGLSTWISTRDIPVGADWEQEIMDGLRASKCLVLLFSGAAENSKHVSREVSQADKADKVIIPVRIDEFPGDKFDYVLDRVQWISAIDGLKDALIESLAKRISDIREGGCGSRPPHRSARKVDDPFSVPLTHTGPILPAPKAGEVWADMFGEKEREAIAELKTEPDDSKWSIGNMIAWYDDSTVVYGASQRIFKIKVNDGRSYKFFSVQRWRGRFIHDFCASPSKNSLFICGDRFTRSIGRESSGVSDFGFLIDEDHVWYEGWNRILVSPNGNRIIHTGHRIGDRSKNRIKRLFGIPDKLKQYDKSYHVDFAVYEKLYRHPVATISGDPRKVLAIRHPDLQASSTDMSWSASGRYLGIFARRRGHVIAFDPTVVSERTVAGDFRPLSDLGQFVLVGGMAWHPTRDIYACGYWAKDETPQHGFIIVDAETREVIHERPLERSGETTSLDWSPDGRFLALGGEDNAIFLWDFSRDAASTILGHKGQVGDVFFSPDGKRLLSSGGSEIIVWDPLNLGAEIARMEGGLGPGLRSSPWSPSGQRIMMFAGQGVRVVELQ